MIVGGQTEARAQLSSTIIDYREPFDQGFTLRTSKKVYTALIRPLFDYAEAAWGEFSGGCCKELQRFQNRAARIMFGKKNSKDTLRVLNRLSLVCRRGLHKCT